MIDSVKFGTQITARNGILPVQGPGSSKNAGSVGVDVFAFRNLACGRRVPVEVDVAVDF